MDDRTELKLLARDGGIALGAVVVVFLLAYGYTGNWPPLVVVESGSMEHDEPTRTCLGTIDTGDLVLVKTGTDDIVTYLAGKRTGYQRYGDYGDVIVYFKNGLREYNGKGTTPVIHRVMAWVDVLDNNTYYVRGIDTWFDADEGITISEIGAQGLTGLQNSGYLTKGDSVHNPHVDQQTHHDAMGKTVQPVRPEWIEGVARGELPWFGLIKLRLTQPDNYKAAPKECKRMLLVGLVVVIGGPFAVSYLWEQWRGGEVVEKERSGKKTANSSQKGGRGKGERDKAGRRNKDKRQRR